MKHLYLTGLFFLMMVGVILPTESKASHAAGGEIIYEWLGDSTYRFFFKFYRDCTGITEPATQTLCLYNNCNNQTYNVVMNKWTGTLPPYGATNGSPVSAGCSQYKNKCDNTSSPLPGYREWWYSAIYTLPVKCNSWRFAVWIGARNNSNNIVGGNFYVETIFNSQVSWQNSSPYFSVKPIPYVCINQPYTFNNGAIDPDLDSLSSQVINPLDGFSCSTPATNIALRTLTPAISFPSNPIQTNGSFSLNAQTGQMTFTATQLGPSTLTIKTREYRNGVEIGSIMRDVQVQVLQCTTQPPTVVPDTPKVGGGLVNGVINACMGETIDFCFDVTSADSETILVVEDNLAQAIPAATMTYTNQKSDSVVGCFSWTPGASDVGLNNFIVTVKDSTCKPPGIMLFYGITVPINVWGKVQAVPDTSICPREATFLGVIGGGQYEWTIMPGGDANSLNNPNIANPVARPTVTTTYVVTSKANEYCKNNTDTVNIAVLQGPEIDGQNDTTICPGTPANLDVKLKKLPGFTYTVKWTPGTYLSSDTISDPVASPPTDQTYIVELGSTQNKCKAYDTVIVDVLDGFSIENPDTAVCYGDVISIRGKGDSRYIYEWSTISAGNLFSQRDIVDPTITMGEVGTFEYVLRARYLTCPDSVFTMKIETQPVPTVQVDEDASLCYGDTMKLHGTVDPDPSVYTGYTYKWSPGASLDKDDILEPIFSGTTTTTLVFTASTSAGCSDKDTVTLSVFPASFLFVNSDTAICPGDSVLMDLTANGAASFQWSPDFNISDTRSLNPRVWPITDQEYMVYGVDTNDCSDTAYIKIVVRPRAIMDLPDTVTLYPGEGHRMDPKGNCLYYSWFPPLGLDDANLSNPYAQPEVNTRYIVRGITSGGCVVTDSVDVLVMTDSYIEVPNAFVPGAYGENKALHLLGRGNVELQRFAIYNRWGVKMFETKDINEGWDGRYNGEVQPMGVYIYTVEAVSPSGRKINKQGNITLIR